MQYLKTFALGTFAIQLIFARAESRPAVDVMIVLAVDVSSSVDDEEYELQRQGIVEALADREVGYVLETCNAGGVGITYMEWSGAPGVQQTKQQIAWNKMHTAKDLSVFAHTLLNKVHRAYGHGDTDILSALVYSNELFETAPLVAERKIINISGDGTQNISPNMFWPASIDPSKSMAGRLKQGRDVLLKKHPKLTIDALTIKDNNHHAFDKSEMLLPDYFRAYVIGGHSAHVLEVADRKEYGDTLKSMLIRELNNCGS